MEPVRTAGVVKGDGFIHQIKWDGIRGVAEVKDGTVEVYSKNGAVCGASYPELLILPQSVGACHAVLDGEIVVFAAGRPSFYHVLRRHRTRNAGTVRYIAARYPARYIVFDLLFLDGEDMRTRPLEERQRMLAECFVDTPVAAKADSFDDGEALFALMKQRNMEGIVSKRQTSRYTAGKKHVDWFKTKTEKKMLCAVTGVRRNDSLPASLALGIYIDGELVDIGHVSAGLKRNDFEQIRGITASEKGRECPVLTCWVRFAEWTPGGTLRHPVLLGFSDEDAAKATGEEFCI
ncbi:MAG: RNA ligase family protein [Eubacteriales bacterium]|nr:RNA ligase family protein [Eubacteriales bacterium]